MSTMIRRNLVIGLGGTGLSAVYSLKRKYESVFGTQRPLGTRFLVLDTTDFKPAGGVTLLPSEFIKLGVADASRVLQQNPKIKRWFPAEPAIPLGAISSGAGQLRPLGRLALFHNAVAVGDSIRKMIEEVRAINPDNEEEGIKITHQSILVQVVGSLSGGTGSGTFLDVGHLCRSEMGTDDGRLVGMFLLPDVFVGKPATFNVEANAYAALKELDYYMGLTSDQTFSYEFGNQSVRVEKPPFDVVYLTNNRNREGLAFTDINDVYDQISMAVHLASGGSGSGAQDILDNLRQYIGTQSFNGKIGFYAGVGVSELVLDRGKLADELALRAALNGLVATFAKTDDEDVDREVSEFLEANNLVEHEKDQLIDALLPQSQFSRKPPLDDVVGRKDLLSLPGISDAFRNSVRSSSQDALGRAQPDLESKVLPEIGARISARLNRPRGLPHAMTFLNRMIGRLEAFRNEMTQEASDFARKLEAQRPSYESVLQEAQDRSGSILTGRGAVREIVLQIGQLLTNEGRNIAEGLRRTAAAEVYTRIIDESRQKLEELSALRERIDLVERRLQRELEELSAQKGSRHPFRISVDVPASIRELSMDSRAFVDWLKESGGGFEGLLMKDANALTESFRAFGHAVPEVAKVATLTIDQVLERVSNKERMSYIERLDRMASPMWNYDDATVHAAHVPQKILLFGVQNLSKMILDPQEIKDSIPMTGPPNFAEVGDPERIYVYKVELVSPAFAITGMRRYSLAYNELRKRTPFHLEAGFDRDPARDLWPAVGGSEALRAWSLANAPVFGRMDQNGLHYSVRSERKGAVLDRHLVKLGQGRINASQKFVDDPELVEEVMESVRKVLNSRGIQAVMSELRSHSDALVQLGRRSSDPNARNLITSEIEAIDEFIAEHTTMI